MTDNNNTNNIILSEMEALLEISAHSNEALMGVPAAAVANPIADTEELLERVVRINALVRSLNPLSPQANNLNE